MYDSKGGRKDSNFISIIQDILTHLHHSSFPSFLLAVIEKWVAFEIYRVRMVPLSRHNCCLFASYICFRSSCTLLEATLGL